MKIQEFFREELKENGTIHKSRIEEFLETHAASELAGETAKKKIELVRIKITNTRNAKKKIDQK